MTAPTAIADITARISQVQARIAAVTAPAATSSPAATSAAGSPTTEASTFAGALASANNTSLYAALGGSTATAPTTTPAATTTPTDGSVGGAAITSDAKKYLGIPYVWGGESTSGLDCSGLVQKTFSDLGISVPRTAAEQQASAKVTPVASLAEAQPGDLLFFGRPAHHVAIYLGHNQLIESPEPGKTVHITDVYATPTSIGRVAGVDSLGAASSLSSTSGGKSASALTAAGVSSAVAAYANQFAAAEHRYHLPSGLLAAVAQQESGGNTHAVSPDGAQGLMQLMPATAAGQGVNAFDPAEAIGAAARIFSGNLSRFGNSVPLALAAYNAGAGAVAKYGGIPPYSETQNYVRRITATLAAGG